MESALVNHVFLKKIKTLELQMAHTLPFNGDSYTLQEIANMLGVTRERARQIEMQALKKLKHPRFRKQWETITQSIGMIGNEH